MFKGGEITLDRDKRPLAPLPKYRPKVSIRITDDRSRRMSEFSIDLPVQGHLSDINLITEKLRLVLEMHGILLKSKEDLPMKSPDVTQQDGA